LLTLKREDAGIIYAESQTGDGHVNRHGVAGHEHGNAQAEEKGKKDEPLPFPNLADVVPEVAGLIGRA
ncbi:MAG: hypothetical protein ACKOUM_01605, partial [Sphingopyxis sp.]